MTISVFLGVISVLSLYSTTGHCRTWNVFVDQDGDAPSIQAGIDSSSAGDTILVYPGIFREQIDYLGKNIVIRSHSGPENTTIDGTGFTSVVLFQNDESRDACLEGFTITSGGRGILILQAEPTIQKNIISKNGGVMNGSGIWCVGTSGDPWAPLIKDNQIIQNQAVNLAGGIGTLKGMIPDIVDNVIVQNIATQGDGGGIYFRGQHEGGRIEGNHISENRAGDHGGGVYIAFGSNVGTVNPVVAYNLIRGNEAMGFGATGTAGGGIALSQAASWVHHNTIVENSAQVSAGFYGGGIAIEIPGDHLIEQNIIAFSLAGGGILCFGGVGGTIRNNMAWENSGGEGSGPCRSWSEVNGNLLADPAFCNRTAGDFSLSEDSPALTHPAGPLGAIDLPGCGPTAVTKTTWSSIKVKYES